MRQEMRHSRRPPVSSWPSYSRPLTHALIVFATILSIAAFPPPEAYPVGVGGFTYTAPTRATSGPFEPWYVNSQKLCVEQTDGVDASGIPVYSATRQWGDRNAALWIWHENNRASDNCYGFQNYQILDVEMTNVADGACWHYYLLVNANRHVTRAILYLNTRYVSCWSTYERKAHYVSAAIGHWLGLAGTSYWYSVMNPDTYDTFSWPTNYDIAGINDKYWYWRKV